MVVLDKHGKVRHVSWSNIWSEKDINDIQEEEKQLPVFIALRLPSALSSQAGDDQATTSGWL